MKVYPCNVLCRVFQRINTRSWSEFIKVGGDLVKMPFSFNCFPVRRFILYCINKITIVHFPFRKKDRHPDDWVISHTGKLYFTLNYNGLFVFLSNKNKVTTYNYGSRRENLQVIISSLHGHYQDLFLYFGMEERK